MSIEANKTIVRRIIEAINQQNLASLDALVAPDFVYHTATQQLQGLGRMKQLVEEELKGFPDLCVTIEDLIAEGDTVWVRLTETVTHTGDFRGLAPTGKKLTYAAVAIWRILDGRVVEGWGVYDQLEFLKELGVLDYKGFPEG